MTALLEELDSGVLVCSDDGRGMDEAVRVRILRKTKGPLLVPAECGADAGLLGAAMAGVAAWG